MRMNESTRARLLAAATELFADHGYRGAPVRAICDLAGANPGAVSYHFGGKRQLYRAVLRQAAERLAPPPDGPGDDVADPSSIAEVVQSILDRVERHPRAARLMLRDLADGGTVAVEALAPALQRARAALASALGEDDASRPSARVDGLFVELAAPVALLTVAWPVLERALRLDAARRREILAELVGRALRGLPGA